MNSEAVASHYWRRYWSIGKDGAPEISKSKTTPMSHLLDGSSPFFEQALFIPEQDVGLHSQCNTARCLRRPCAGDTRRPAGTLPTAFLHLLCLLTLLVGCQSSGQDESAILIGIKTEAVAAIKNLQQPDPRDTGIPSLDALNARWNVQAMTRVFDVSPTDEAAVKAGLTGVYKLTVSPGTNLRDMVAAYAADPHVAYAEINAQFEAK